MLFRLREERCGNLASGPNPLITEHTGGCHDSSAESLGTFPCFCLLLFGREEYSFFASLSFFTINRASLSRRSWFPGDGVIQSHSSRCLGGIRSPATQLDLLCSGLPGRNGSPLVLHLQAALASKSQSPQVHYQADHLSKKTQHKKHPGGEAPHESRYVSASRAVLLINN